MTDTDKGKLESVGLRFRARRNELYYSLKDVSNLTGISTGTLNGIEKGKDLTFTNFLVLCRTLQIQPRTFFEQDIDFKSPYALPPDVSDRISVSKKLDKLVYDSDFFDSPRRVADVLHELGIDKAQSNKFSVHMSSYCDEGVLTYEKRGNYKVYQKKISTTSVVRESGLPV